MVKSLVLHCVQFNLACLEQCKIEDKWKQATIYKRKEYKNEKNINDVADSDRYYPLKQHFVWHAVPDLFVLGSEY